MSRETVKCTNDNIKKIVKKQIKLLGNEADLNHLDVSEVTCMHGLFDLNLMKPSELYLFNGDISKWDVSNVEQMDLMFMRSSFNGDIGNWDVSSVKDMKGMFQESKFNKDIGNWDVGNAKEMNFMFFASSFIQDISNWDMSNVSDTGRMFEDCPIPEENKPKFKD